MLYRSIPQTAISSPFPSRVRYSNKTFSTTSFSHPRRVATLLGGALLFGLCGAYFLIPKMVVIIEKSPTTATPASLYKIWLDVPNWKNWDADIETSTLTPDASSPSTPVEFKNGAKGVLQMTKEGNLKGARYDFTLVNVVPNRSFAYDVTAPGANMRFFFDFEDKSATSESANVICGATLTGALGWLYKLVFHKMFKDTMHACAVKLSEQAQALESTNAESSSSAISTLEA